MCQLPGGAAAMPYLLIGLSFLGVMLITAVLPDQWQATAMTGAVFTMGLGIVWAGFK